MVDATRPNAPVVHADAAEHRRQIATVLNQLVVTTPDYSRTPAEISANVTPVDRGYPELHVLRYGRNDAPGTTDMTTALKNAIKVASYNGAREVVDSQSEFDGVGGTVIVPAGTFRLTEVVKVWPHVNIVGAGKTQTVFSCTEAASGLFWTDEAPNGTSFRNSGGLSGGFTVFGNNAVTGNLVAMDTVVERTFADMLIYWSKGNGLHLANVQNSLFSCVDVMFNGDTDAITGSNIVITDGTASNLFLRCEIAGPAEYNLEVADDAAGNPDRNVFVDCIFERFKGQYVGTYYPTAIAPTLKCHIYADGDNGAPFNLFFIDCNITLNDSNVAVPAIIMKNGGTISLQSCRVQGYEAAVTPISIGVQFGPHALGATARSTLILTGLSTFSAFDVLMDTYGTLAVVKDYGASFAGDDITTIFQNDGSQTIEDVWLTSFESILELRGGQIKFPATQNASSNANTLDDYEEGTWTPALKCNGTATGITPVSVSANYTKIGRLVHVNCRITASISGADAGAVTISGLPFTPVGFVSGTLAMGSYSGVPNGTVIHAEILGSSDIGLFAPNDGAAQATNTALDSSNLSANVGFHLSGSYMTS